eukprot:196928_1
MYQLTRFYGHLDTNHQTEKIPLSSIIKIFIRDPANDYQSRYLICGGLQSCTNINIQSCLLFGPIVNIACNGRTCGGCHGERSCEFINISNTTSPQPQILWCPGFMSCSNSIIQINYIYGTFSLSNSTIYSPNETTGVF